MIGIKRPTTRAICAAAVLIALQYGYSIPSSAATCENQFIWTVDDGAATAAEPMGLMQKWSTEGTLLDSFEFNSYRRFTGDISLSADGKHLYGIAYSADSNGYWAGSDYHDVLDSYSESGPADLQSLENTDLTLTGSHIGPDEDYQTTTDGVTNFSRLEASWLVDNWATEAGYYWARGGAVISENTMVIDRDYWSGQLLKIDLADNRTATNWVNLHDADESLIEAGQISGFPIDEQTVFNAWGLGGDVVLMADGDVLVLAWNNRFDTASGHAEASERPLLVRLHSNTSDSVITSNDITATVVGRIDIPIRAGESEPSFAYGAGRAGDQLFIGTSNGYLLRMADIPHTSSLDPIAFDVVVDREGTTFGGAAGSNDFTVSNAECTSSTTSNLANTGVDVLSIASTGLVAISTAILLNAFRQRRPKGLSRLG